MKKGSNRNGRLTKSRPAALPGMSLLWLIIALLCFVVYGATRLLSVSAAQQSGTVDDGRITDTALNQITALLEEKASRSPSQRKIDSQLLAAFRISRGESVAQGILTIDTGVDVQADGSVLVVISADVSDELLKRVTAIGGRVISSLAEDREIVAFIPLREVENVAKLPTVKFIARPPIGGTSRPSVDYSCRGLAPISFLAGVSGTSFSRRATTIRSRLVRALREELSTPESEIPFIGSIASQGDRTHRCDDARSSFSVTGVGVKIGVLSDSYNFLGGANGDIAAGDLPGPGNPNGYLTPVTVLQDSFQSDNIDEGRAMLQIVHDLAPGAQLFFATARLTPANFKQNILNLRAAGCDIIVDDYSYLVETPFQEGQASNVGSNTNGGIIAEAVRQVTANGALYFSSVGNSGNLNDGTSGVWEGDFSDGGPVPSPIVSSGRVHSFGSSVLDTVTMVGSGVWSRADLFWSDPLGAAANDYDLFVLSADGSTVVRFSDDVQNGTQDPYERVNSLNPGERIAVVKFSGDPRFLHLDVGRSRLAIRTAGRARGHDCIVAAFSVAATPATSPGPYPNPFNTSNTVESFSTDGPRRVFFQADGTAITPGNFTSTGGAVRQKPDITAADGVATSVPGFNPFFGTSAAAPHAAAIAALLKSKRSSLTSSEIRSALTSTAIDIEASGIDRDSGSGIVQAFQAVESVSTNTNYIGYIDTGDCNVIKGWAADRNRLNTSINVGIYDGSTLLTTVLANQLRSDVGGFLGDNGLHGFNIATPGSLKDGATHTVHVRFESSATELGNSPRSLNCPVTPNYIGYVDTGDCNVIKGWAADRNRLNTSINVSIYDGSTLLTTILANQLRSDVGSFLGDNGLHGFNIATPGSLKDGATHTVHVKFESSATGLGNSPKSINCPVTANYIGYIDTGDCNVIKGWAADRNRLNTSINVSIYDGSTLLTTVLANQLRSDVGSFLGDNGLHGFNIVTPGSLKDGATHTVHVRFESSATGLGNSPKSMNCPVTADYIGYVDTGDCNVIKGWAADRKRLNTSINISIYDGSTLLTTVLANQLRSDVGSFLGDNGLHGFNIATPGSLIDGATHIVHVKFESSTTELGNSPKTISGCMGSQVQLITNGAFASGSTGWTLSGNFFADSRFSNCRSCPGYAYLSNADGTSGNNLNGSMFQTISVPSNASSVTLSFWHFITTQEAGSTPFDVLNVTIQNSSGGFLATVVVLSNANSSTGYIQRTFDLTAFRGQVIRIHFLGTTDFSLPTTFRVDDVSVLANVP